MARTRRICGEQDCEENTRRRNYPLCYSHYLTAESGTIDKCPNHPGVYKPTKYPVCRQCYAEETQVFKTTHAVEEKREQYSTGGWDKPFIEHKAIPLSTDAVARVRKNMSEHARECANHESNTIQYLVDPMLRGLGWNFDDPEQVRKEYRPAKKQRWGKRGIAVDIALFESGTPTVFVEAKRLDREYNPDYRKQIDKYASYMDEGTAVLTNGRFWLVSPVRNGKTGDPEIIDIGEGSAEYAAEKLQSAIGKTTSKKAKRKYEQLDAIKEQLKDYRLRESRRRNKPAYAIFTNETIELIASQRPNSVRELESVNGVGPATLEEHGTEILRIVKG